MIIINTVQFSIIILGIKRVSYTRFLFVNTTYVVNKISYNGYFLFLYYFNTKPNVVSKIKITKSKLNR